MSHIQLDSTAPREVYTVAATPQTDFVIPFAFFDAADIQLYIGGVLKAQPTDYTVTGTAVDGGFSSGTASLAASVTNTTVIVLRNTAIERTDDFPYPSSTLNIKALNTALDRIVGWGQQLLTSFGRTLRQPDSDTAAIAALPASADRAGKVLAFDATTADPIVSTKTLAQLESEADNAAASATESANHATTASRWASKTDGTVVDAETGVDSAEFSAKAYAVGGAVNPTAGSAKDWSTKTDAEVVAGQGFGAKKYANDAAASATAADGSATNAAQSAAQAEAAAASVGFSDVVFVTAAQSPIAITAADSGKLYNCDTSGGAITFNLPVISTLALPFTLGVKKATGDANVLTINAGGTDDFDDGTTSKQIASQYGTTLIPDVDPNPDSWTAADWAGAAIPDGSITANKLATGAVTNDKLNVSAITGQPADAAPDLDNDYALTYDASALSFKKVLLSALAFVRKSLFTTKGDLVVATGASTPARLGVGTNGQVLVADSTQAAGVKWGSAGVQSVSAGTGLTGGTITGTGTISMDTTAGAVGTYVMALVFVNGTYVLGSTAPGSSLNPSSAASNNRSASTLSGTWRCMGYVGSVTCCTTGNGLITLWMRIS